MCLREKPEPSKGYDACRIRNKTILGFKYVLGKNHATLAFYIFCRVLIWMWKEVIYDRVDKNLDRFRRNQTTRFQCCCSKLNNGGGVTGKEAKLVKEQKTDPWNK